MPNIRHVRFSLHLPDEIRNIAGTSAAEEEQEGIVRDVNPVSLQHHVGQAAESIHAGQGRDKCRHMQFGNPEALECTDQQADSQHDDHCNPHIDLVGHQHAADRGCKADHRADRQVDVAAGQDTQQHTGCQHEHISVLGDQVVDAAGFQGTAVGRDGKEDYDNDQRDHHGVFLEKSANAHSVFIHRHAPLPDWRITAIMLSCVASSAFISPTILPSFMM